MFDIDAALLRNLLNDEDALFAFAMRFLRQVLFGEHSIPFKQGARERCIAERKEDWEKRRKPARDQTFSRTRSLSEDGAGSQ